MLPSGSILDGILIFHFTRGAVHGGTGVSVLKHSTALSLILAVSGVAPVQLSKEKPCILVLRVDALNVNNRQYLQLSRY